MKKQTIKTTTRKRKRKFPSIKRSVLWLEKKIHYDLSWKHRIKGEKKLLMKVLPMLTNSFYIATAAMFIGAGFIAIIYPSKPPADGMAKIVAGIWTFNAFMQYLGAEQYRERYWKQWKEHREMVNKISEVEHLNEILIRNIEELKYKNKLLSGIHETFKSE